MPIGGCMMPIIRLKMTTTPKCVGSTPRLSAVGINSGTAISIAGRVSIKNPSTSSSTLAISRKVALSALNAVISAESCAALPSDTNKNDSADDTAMM